MAKVLLLLAGVMNALFVPFHIYLGYQLHIWKGLPAAVRGLLETFNACGSLMILFLAVACLALRREVLSTRLGAAVLTLGALLYLSRAAEEFIWLNHNVVITAICLVAGLAHALALLGVRVAPRPA